MVFAIESIKNEIKNLKVGEGIGKTQNTPIGNFDIDILRVSKDSIKVHLVQDDEVLQSTVYSFPNIINTMIPTLSKKGKNLKLDQFKQSIDIFELIEKYNLLKENKKNLVNPTEYLTPYLGYPAKGTVRIEPGDDDGVYISGTFDCILYKGYISEKDIFSWISEHISIDGVIKCWKDIEEYFTTFKIGNEISLRKSCKSLSMLFKAQSVRSAKIYSEKITNVIKVLENVTKYYGFCNRPISKLKYEVINQLTENGSKKLLLKKEDFWNECDGLFCFKPNINEIEHLFGGIVISNLSRVNDRSLLDIVLDLLTYDFPDGTKLSNDKITLTVLNGGIELKFNSKFF